MDFKDRFEARSAYINASLSNYIEHNDGPESKISEAMKYSLMSGGKRLRPVLSLAVADMLGTDEAAVLPYACSIEMIHTYSLIHDDLPAMDNDSLRRGKPTSHVIFGEATAILAGDALLNLAFETMCADAVSTIDDEAMRRKIKAIGYIAEAAGSKGMIAGQVIDLQSQHKEIDKDSLNYMHQKKTGALIKAAVLAPAIVTGADVQTISTLQAYAENFGLAFQIKDDILDVEGSIAELGKAIGSDRINGKSTFINVYGLEASKETLSAVTSEAINALSGFGEAADFLKELTRYMSSRTR